jgi:predicted ATPase
MGFELAEDHVRQDVRVRFAARHDEGFEATQASDGTLRALAILAALHDPQSRGTLVVEEPEDGIYPERMPTFLRIMGEDACRPDADPADAPLRQLIITTHSPAAAKAVPREHLVVFESATRVGAGLSPSRVTVPRRVLRDGERPAREPFAVPPVSEAELAAFTGRRG